MNQLDLKDRKILQELEKDARAPLSIIARKVGVSKQLLGYKIRRLEETGIIEGYHALIDTSRLGFTTYRVYLRLQNLTQRKNEKLFRFLANLKETAIMFTLDGRWDAGMAIMVKSIYEFYTFWEKVMAHKALIADYHISIYSPIYHFRRSFLSEKKEKSFDVLILGGKEKADYDDLDLEILKELAPNVRRPLTDIAKKLGKSPQLVINRLKIIEKKGIIQGYRPILNWEKLGYGYYKIDITLTNFSKYNELFSYCKQHPYIVQIDKTIGGSDFEIEIYTKSKTHFREIMQELQDKFEGMIKNYEYFTLEKTYKEVFFPA